MHHHRPLCVHLLGGLRAWTSEQGAITTTAWRTSKNMDLLRLLALSNGRPVRAAHLVETLWPDARPDRGRHSLRTAASQLRHALGGPYIVRQPDGLVLLGAWVDVQAFESGTHEAQQALDDERPLDALRRVRAADELYSGSFRASDDAGAWAASRRAHVEAVRQELYVTGARAALQLDLPRDAQQWAQRATELDSGSESAVRALIEAYAELGEIAHALRAFERYREHLAEELGADPSPQTQELHLRVLRARG